MGDSGETFGGYTLDDMREWCEASPDDRWPTDREFMLGLIADVERLATERRHFMWVWRAASVESDGWQARAEQAERLVAALRSHYGDEAVDAVPLDCQVGTSAAAEDRYSCAAMTETERLTAERDEAFSARAAAVRANEMMQVDLGEMLDEVRRERARAEQAEAKLVSIVTPGEKMHPGLSGRYIRVESQAPCVVSADGRVTPLPDGPFWWDGTQACQVERCSRCLGTGRRKDSRWVGSCPECKSIDGLPVGWVAVPLDEGDDDGER